MSSTALPIKGLEGIIATKSSICWIDGEAGVLSYRGIDIHELAKRSTFEETTYLLWFGVLPTATQLAEFSKELAFSRALNWRIYEFLRNVPTDATPMEVLRTAVSLLSLYDPDEKDSSHASNVRKSYRLTSQIAMIVAIFDRIRKGRTIIDPDRTLSHSANFLRMLNGVNPSETATRALDVALILQADHELNASTFAARVIASTLSDIHSAIVGAIGALKGPLHGGANAETMKILYAIDEAGADPVDYVKQMFAEKKKISGFGHRVYTTEDPRATHLRKMSEDLGKAAEAALEWLAKGEQESLVALRDRLEQGILTQVAEAGVNGADAARVVNTSNLYFDHVEAEALVIALDLKGLAVSGGSACQSGATEPSHVLLAMGLSQARARSSIRFSLSRMTTGDEVECALALVPAAVERLRKLSPAKRLQLTTDR